MAETLILVDRENTTVGYAPRRECHAGDGLLHRAVAVVILDGAGRVLLQHRRSHLWDGFWDLTGATHPLFADGREESPLEAAHRCLASEWNIAAPLRESFAFTYFERHGDWSEHEYCVVLCGRHDGPVDPNPDNAYGFRWVALHECLEDLIRSAPVYTPWAAIALPRLGDALAQNR